MQIRKWLVLFASLLLLFGPGLAELHAVGPATASTTINLTVTESVSISVDKTSVSMNYASGSAVFPAITVTSSWFTNGTENNFDVYASFSSANALSNGSSFITADKISAAVTGTAPINGLFTTGFPPTIGGSFANTVTDGVSVPNAVWIFEASINGNVQGAPHTWTPTPSGTATNAVTLTVTPGTTSLVPGTYSGVLLFTATTS